MTLLFKKDKDILDLESDLGKLRKQDGNIEPLNPGSCFSILAIFNGRRLKGNAALSKWVKM